MPATLDQLDFDFGLPASASLSEPARPIEGDAVGAAALYRHLVCRHHQAMLAGDLPLVFAIRAEARQLAIDLNGGTVMGMFRDDSSPASVLETGDAASPGVIPQWGQRGRFCLTLFDMRVRVVFRRGLISLDPILYWPGFDVYALDEGGLFLNANGFYAFDAPSPKRRVSFEPYAFVQAVLLLHIERELQGKLVKLAGRIPDFARASR